VLQLCFDASFPIAILLNQYRQISQLLDAPQYRNACFFLVAVLDADGVEIAVRYLDALYADVRDENRT
jgi:hypothetical protein